MPTPSKQEQILQTHAGLIGAVVQTIYHPELNNSLSLF